VTGAVETDTETERNYGNGEDEDNAINYNKGEKNFFSRFGIVFSLDGAL